MADGQRLHFRDQVLGPAELQVRVDPPLQREQSLVSEPSGGGPGEWHVRHIGERLAAPQGKRRVEQG